MSNRAWAALAVVAALVGGLYLGGHPEVLPGPIRDVFVEQRARLDDEVLRDIQDNYWRKVDPTVLQQRGARAMVDQIRSQTKDKFSDYFDPKQFAAYQDATKGQLSGVGMAVTQVPAGLRISETFPSSPARAAGLTRGDVITAVNGRSIAGTDSTVATGLIRGPAGTEVKLTVRSPKQKPRTLTLTRAEVTIPVVRGRLVHVNGRPVAYVEMAQFTPDVHGVLRREIEKLDAQGAKGLILDLRNNGGGLLDEAVSTAAIFLPGQTTVVTTDSRTQGSHVYKSSGTPLPRQPTVVLVNRDTASAAEILTAALGENHAATIVGQRTYGKGVFQQLFPLDAGGGLKLTIGEYLTSNGTSIAGKGIEPQVPAKDNSRTIKDEALRSAERVLAPKLGN